MNLGVPDSNPRFNHHTNYNGILSEARNAKIAGHKILVFTFLSPGKHGITFTQLEKGINIPVVIDKYSAKAHISSPQDSVI